MADPTTSSGSPDGDASPDRRFVHLHVHTEFSKQDGLARVEDLVSKAKANGQPALAMTDHGNLAGTWKFYQACQAAGIKPILGVEAYLALVPAGSEDGKPELAWDDPAVRYARATRMQPDAESGKVKRSTNQHLTILVRNQTGWRNLCRMMNAAQESFYYQPLIDYALLKRYSEGLVVLTGCLGGPVASRVAVGDIDGAREALNRLVACVGQDDVYVEVMEHGLAAEGKDHIKALAALAKAAGVRVVATNDSHYVEECDHDAHDSWLVNGELARGNKVSKDDPDRWRFNGAGYHLRSAAEMYGLYPNARTWQAACAETVRLAARVDDEVIPIKPLRLPRFPVPTEAIQAWENGAATAVETSTVADYQAAAGPARAVGGRAYRSAAALYLHRLVRDGAVRRYGHGLSEEVKRRLRFEEDVITQMGLEDYFLIVWDTLAWARSDRGLPTSDHPHGAPGAKTPILVGPGRGSAAGSAISYCLEIVMVDPLAHGLLFERFLDVTRAGMPDIDVDFEAARRDEIYTYLAARYGEDHVARIGAFQVAKSKRALKDAARVLGHPRVGERLAAAVPVHQGKPQPFAQLLHERNDLDEHDGSLPGPASGASGLGAREFQSLVASDPAAAEVVALARRFENVVAGESIHAAGVIVSDEPLTDLIPLHRRRDKKTGAPTGVPVAAWDGKDIEAFGLLKLDALALSNLDVVAATVANIRATTGEHLDPDQLPTPDHHPGHDSDRESDQQSNQERVGAAFAMLREGRTEGVFQMESPGMTRLCEQIAPASLDDLTALVALYRPGPMAAGTPERYADRKNGRAEVDYSIYTTDPAEQAVIAASLDQTFGLPAYQEQLMSLAGDVAGFTAAERNQLRKAFSKKDRPAMEALKAVFVRQGQQPARRPDGTTKPGFGPATLERLWVTFDGSAEYLFNKSHAAAYGQIAYVTAYLKANWPTEYAAATLAVVDKEAKRRATLFALRNQGITVLAPDINHSQQATAPDTAPAATTGTQADTEADTEADTGSDTGTDAGHDSGERAAVRLGLAEIRDVGGNAGWILAERERGGRFTSLGDLLARVGVPSGAGQAPKKLPVTAAEALIEAGAFDSLGHPRLGLMMAVRATSAGAEPDIPELEWTPLERSARQRLRLGIALGEHPMDAYAVNQPPAGPSGAPAAGVAGGSGDAQASVSRIGVVATWSERTTRRGTKLANFTLEDQHTLLDGVAFSRALARIERHGHQIAAGDLVTVTGQMNTRTVTVHAVNDDGEEIEETREVNELIADRIEPLHLNDTDNSGPASLPDSDSVHLAELIRLARHEPTAPTTDEATDGGTDGAGDSHDSSRRAVLRVVEDPTPPPAPAPGPPGWDVVVQFANNWLFTPTHDDGGATQRWLLGSPRDPDSPLAGNGDIDIARPAALQDAEERAFALNLRCYCTCEACARCRAHAKGQHPNDQGTKIQNAPVGACDCLCEQCRAHSSRAGWQALLVATNQRDHHTASLIATIDPGHPAWTPLSQQGWRTAALADLLGADLLGADPAGGSVSSNNQQPDQRHDQQPDAQGMSLGWRPAAA